MNKTIQAALAASLSLALIGNASAGPDRRHHGDDYRPYYQSQKHYAHGHAPQRHRHRDRHDWIGPAALVALTGVAIGAAAYHYQTPTTVYSAPPPAPSGSWYFCRSSGQYYPYTDACPEGWQAVAPR